MSLPVQNPPRQHHPNCITQPNARWDGGFCYWCERASRDGGA